MTYSIVFVDHIGGISSLDVEAKDVESFREELEEHTGLPESYVLYYITRIKLNEHCELSSVQTRDLFQVIAKSAIEAGVERALEATKEEILKALTDAMKSTLKRKVWEISENAIADVMQEVVEEETIAGVRKAIKRPRLTSK
ncbi:hypothetical protein WOLCODRAFT_145159 [Wolfiporia cocos MD-104 SS10]|uniref:Uncharacterized protein n=1 Tax=Wolfiporia cocos (strain MD-104) TaxID=742152 RepID=A0A2H3JXR4_WOLCO|nr:hypothetical protein WOLCODRAFT_145159 [Wolfiporia cocos MD-104 SS10]